MEVPSIERDQLATQFRQLGITPGGILFVHCSLSSIGEVAGGAAGLIEALLEVLTPDGTLMFPTQHVRDGSVFDSLSTPSALGLVTETFRRMPGVSRSRHPYHSVAARGARAADMLRDHERSPIPDGPDTPYGRLVTQGGQVLLIGCDLNTFTLLHTVEAELKIPYLTEHTLEYLDEHGQVRSVELEGCPVLERRNVWAFDRLFRTEGAMVIGKVGRAVCRLIDAEKSVRIMRRELVRDPTFALGDNLHFDDVRLFRGKLKAARLAEEDFRLAALLRLHEENRARCLKMIRGEGIRLVEIDSGEEIPPAAELTALGGELKASGLAAHSMAVRMTSSNHARAIAQAAGALGVARVRLLPPEADDWRDVDSFLHEIKSVVDAPPLAEIDVLLSTTKRTVAASLYALSKILAHFDAGRLGVAYDPAGVAMASAVPFYDGLYNNSRIRGRTRQVQIADRVAETDQPAKPGWGNSEIKEIISNLRCRSFDGVFCLEPLEGVPWQDGFRESAAGFWEIMDSI